MSKKRDRAWFVCPQWPELVSRYYPDDGAAARALHADVKVLARLRQQTPVAKATLLRMLRRLGGQHRIDAAAHELINDTRPH
jgi:hypothetical protein